jgi:hypothetical protein
MTSEHIFFIPAMLLLGGAIGYVVGRKLLLAEQDEQRRAQARRQNAVQDDSDLP